MPGRPGTTRRIALAAVLAASVLVTPASLGWSAGPAAAAERAWGLAGGLGGYSRLGYWPWGQ
jgi:hypothetical protein